MGSLSISGSPSPSSRSKIPLISDGLVLVLNRPWSLLLSSPTRRRQETT
ncbi:rCG46779 [Rattus norvegicus]|uniref:RCG46779 n=1 Tax=Rattus norvegicus TaxID=10116 RepID=A6IX48_RAT|nr:rCG46779 [Rattus norvegicus]